MSKIFFAGLPTSFQPFATSLQGSYTMSPPSAIAMSSGDHFTHHRDFDFTEPRFRNSGLMTHEHRNVPISVPQFFRQRQTDILEPNAPEGIRVYTHVSSDMDVILNEGLKPRSLFDPSVKEKKSYCLPDRYDHVYFRVKAEDRDSMTRFMSKRDDNWIAIDVAPDTIVYNSELRATNDPSYYDSRVTLQQAIEYLKQRYTMNRPDGTIIVFDPWSMRPIAIPYSDARAQDFRWMGSFEVIVSKTISPEFFSEVIFKK